MTANLSRTGRTGLLLLNLGTPDGPDTASVRRYLKQFLSDPRVIDISAIGRWLLLNIFILPFRPAKSAAAYQKVWTKEGSPLLVHSLALRDRMRERLSDGWQVELGMRYGNPSIASALQKLRESGVDRIVVAPLFPQYASSSTGSALEELFRVAGSLWNVPHFLVLPPFYDHPDFLDAFAAIGRARMQTFKPDYVLFSFHGLPERQILKSDDSGQHCLKSTSCCEQLVPSNRNCYRAQSFETARQIARRLDLKPDQWSVAFQSRLGRTPWIKPYTDLVLPELVQRGVKRLMVYDPAFVADCLETLEEIGIRAKEQFIAAGGEDLQLVPSLNSDPKWVEALVAMVSPLTAGRALPVIATG